MGAYSTLCAFDVERLRTLGAPAVRAQLTADAGIDLGRDCSLHPGGDGGRGPTHGRGV